MGDELDELFDSLGDDAGEIADAAPVVMPPKGTVHEGTIAERDAAVADGAMPRGRYLELPTTHIREGDERILESGEARHVGRWSPQLDAVPEDNGEGGVQWRHDNPREDLGSRINASLDVELPANVRGAAAWLAQHGSAVPGGAMLAPIAAGVARNERISPEGFAALPFGVSDEVAGVAGAAMGGGYEESRDRARRRRDHVAARAPESAMAGDIAANLAVAPLLPTAAGAGMLPAGTGAGAALARTAIMAGEGAAYGAAGGFGASDQSGVGLAEDTANTAALGAAGGAIMQGGAEVAAPISRAIQRGAGATGDRHRLAALGARKRDLDLAERNFPGGVEGAADAARTNRLTSPVETVDGLTSRAPDVQARAVEGIQEALSATGDDASISVGALQHRIQQRIGSGPLPSQRSASSNVEQALANWADDRAAQFAAAPTTVSGAPAMAPAGGTAVTRAGRPAAGAGGGPFRSQSDSVSLQDLQELKQTLREGARFEVQTNAAGAEAYRDAYREVATIMDEIVEQQGRRIGDPNALQRYQAARRQYQIARMADDWGQAAANREAGRRVASPSDQGAAVVGAALTGNMGGAAAGFAFNRFVRSREHSIAATAYETIARHALVNPQQLGPWARALGDAARRGPGAFAATFYALQHRDPKFRAQMREVNGQEDEGRRLEAAGSARPMGETTPDTEQDQ